MPAINFQTLWNNHPAVAGNEPVLDTKTYTNQCAINLSASLMRSNVSLTGFHGALSWQKGGPKYAIRAQELADWLRGTFPTIPRRFEKVEPQDFSKNIAGKTGIIFFQNYWGTNNQGDHIDLWNAARLTHLWTWLQIYGPRFGQNRTGFNTDLRKAESIWFWSIS